MSALGTTMLFGNLGTKVLKKAAPAPAKPAAKPAPKAAPKPAPKPAAKPVVAAPKPAAKPGFGGFFSKPDAKPATKVVAKPAPKPVAKPAPKPVAKPAPKPVAKPAAKPVAKPAAKKFSFAAGSRSGGVGYRKYEGRPLWLPNAEVPKWLDGSLPGDRGFDPLGLSKPVEYLQLDVDSLDQNRGVNRKGDVVGSFSPVVDKVSTDRLQPYSEVFGLARFRECELIHGRWCMLATLGCIVAESNTGVSWVDAGKVELDGASYFGFDLPFSLTQLVWFEALAVGGAELYRNSELNPEKRCYPGGYFDPLGFAKEPERALRLKEAEIKHGRLAMVAFFGFGAQALATGEGVLGSLAKFSDTL